MIGRGSRRVLFVVVVALAMLGTTATGAWAAGPTAYVTNQSDNTVTPIAVATNTPGTPIPVGNTPLEVAITPDGQTAYVANLGDNTVTPIAVATNTPGTPIPVGNTPLQVAITPDGQTAYVTNSGDNTVTPIAVATNTPSTPIPVGSNPVGVAITPDGQTAYVLNESDNTVTPIAVATNTPGTPIPVGAAPYAVAITPDGQTAYVTNSGDNTVTPIAVATNTPSTPIPVGTSPFGVAITPDGQTAYVTNYSDNTVTPIAVATNTPGTPIPVGTNPYGMAITPAPPAPTSITAPSISGSAQQSQTLTASHGSWAGDPTGYSEQWQDCDRSGAACADIIGATGQTYTLTAADVGHTIRVRETASNAGATGSPASSLPTNVVSAAPTPPTPPPTTTTPMPGAPAVNGCPTATGRLSGATLGRLTLGMTRKQALSKYAQSSARGERYWDFFCVSPIGVRVGYASNALLKTLTAGEQNTVRGRVVLALTANPFYALRGVRPGASRRSASRTLHTGAAMHVGLNYWYMAPNGSTTAVIKVRDGSVEEIGTATKMVTQGRKPQLTFIKSFS